MLLKPMTSLRLLYLFVAWSVDFNSYDVWNLSFLLMAMHVTQNLIFTE